MNRLKPSYRDALLTGLDIGLQLGMKLYGEKVFIAEYDSYFPIPSELKDKVVSTVLKGIKAELKENTAKSDGIF